MGMNDHTTGETATCTVCRAPIEHGILLKGYQGHPGIPIWRTLDRGHACTVCDQSATKRHQPGTIRHGIPT